MRTPTFVAIQMYAAALWVTVSAALVRAEIDFAGPRDAKALIALYAGNIQPDELYVKLSEGLLFRARGGALVRAERNVPGLHTGDDAALTALNALGVWSAQHDVSEDELESQRIVAQKNLGVALPDLRLEFRVRLAPGRTIENALDLLNAPVGALRTAVEIALPAPRPVALPVPPNFQSLQRYLNPSPSGIGSAEVWAWPSGRGDGVRVCDVEYSWNASHTDLPAFTRLGPVGVDPFSDNNHGTAVLGEMVSLNNGSGTTGAVSNVAPYVACANTASGYNPAAAILNASAGLRAGDVILIEQQIGGPNGQYCPTEWILSVYNAVRQASGNGRIVVEAAGNGGQNLDSAIFNTGHRPFLAANDSGAIIVGAGAAPSAASGSTVDRSRLSFSCYGSTVDLQGWGERVSTCAYGDAYSAEGANAWFTTGFSGTSSASPIVASSVIGLQAVYKAVTGAVLTPAQAKQTLRDTGAAQTAGINPATQNIGPRPNARAAIARIFGDLDCNTNARPDRIDIFTGASADANGNSVPDECEIPSCDTIDFNADGVSPDSGDVADYLSVFSGGSCSTGAACGGGTNDIDFNNDGVSPDSADIAAFLRVFGGGSC